MNTKMIIYPVTLLLMVWVPVVRYYVSTPDINACVLDYVENLEESNYEWYMYDIGWVKHIEPWNSRLNESLKQYRVWKSNWCLMSSDNLFSDLNNTFYCTVTYLIKNAPIKDKYKEPLWILERE
jgi:hypothetical protein